MIEIATDGVRSAGCGSVLLLPDAPAGQISEEVATQITRREQLRDEGAARAAVFLGEDPERIED